MPKVLTFCVAFGPKLSKNTRNIKKSMSFKTSLGRGMATSELGYLHEALEQE
jgi:hypothetical protein